MVLSSARRWLCCRRTSPPSVQLRSPSRRQGPPQEASCSPSSFSSFCLRSDSPGQCVCSASSCWRSSSSPGASCGPDCRRARRGRSWSGLPSRNCHTSYIPPGCSWSSGPSTSVSSISHLSGATSSASPTRTASTICSSPTALDCSAA